jgi:hypothetical protein
MKTIRLLTLGGYGHAQPGDEIRVSDDVAEALVRAHVAQWVTVEDAVPPAIENPTRPGRRPR